MSGLSTTLKKLRAQARFALIGLSCVASAGHAQPTTLVVQMFARPADRPALRSALEHEQLAFLNKQQAQGVLSNYALYFSRYADAGVWDAMELLTFPNPAAETAWRGVERDRPAGLSAQTLAIVQAVESTPSVEARMAGNFDGAPTMLVIPYESLVPGPEYLRYLDGYTVPQFSGWMAEHIVDGYQVLTSRFPADRKWNALILLGYHGDAALARREEIVAKTRARLALDPAWKAISDNKKAIRTEKILAVADRIGSGGNSR